MSLSMGMTELLVERDIVDPMEAVLDAPVPPVEGQQLPGVGLFRDEVGDAEGLFCACAARHGERSEGG